MNNDELVITQLAAVHARLGTIEGKVNLVARAERRHLLELLESTVRSTPLIGQIYLLLDGTRTQTEVVEALGEFSINTSPMSVSRRVTEMETDHGIIEIAQAGKGKVFRKDPAMDKVLNLTVNVRKWLKDEGEIVPELPVRSRKKKTTND